MAGDAQDREAKYWAFISYSHRDAAFGRRLHRRLESYALPARLVGKETKQGPVPRRLAPIFRDRDEFPAAHNLSTEVRAALKASRSLVVVCSPTAAQSTWVAREIELFRELHPGRPILTALAKGEPEESFPDALRFSGPEGAVVEPLAADFRRDGDGTRSALLKLVAGIIGIGLDELVQRDAQRNFRRVMAVTVLAGITVLIMAALTLYAWSAQQEAERQREAAQGLVGFMITDLKEKLRGVGRLDIMVTVNERALQYYDKEPKLSRESRAHRAQVQQALGDVDMDRGKYDVADTLFRDAYSTTAELLADDPNNPDRIFDHAQSEFWIGSVYYQRKQTAAARTKFEAYKRLTDRLVAIAPRNVKYRKEQAFAVENLCVIELREPVNVKAALSYCATSLKEMEDVARQLPPSVEGELDVINRHAWLADAYHADHDIPHAKAERLVQEQMLGVLMTADPKNMDVKEMWVTGQCALAVLEFESGDKKGAVARLHRDLDVVNGLTKYDPENKRWIRDRNLVNAALQRLH